MPIVQFAPLSSLVQPALWHKLTDLKIDVLKLSDASVPISGSYAAGRSVKDRESGLEISLPCNITVGSESFDSDYRRVSRHRQLTKPWAYNILQCSARIGVCRWDTQKLQHHRRIQSRRQDSYIQQ